MPIAYADIESGAVVTAKDDVVEIEISQSGSKNYYAIDNTVGAKRKVITHENGDYYEIKNYELNDGTTIELVYPKGKQNNADSKYAYVNGTNTTQPRVYGKDGVTHIKINYDEYLHSEENVHYVNTVTEHATRVTNNLKVNGSWTQNGKAFDNQIANVKVVNGTNSTYVFSHWEDEHGTTVNNFTINWTNGTINNYFYYAKYQEFLNTNPVVRFINDFADSTVEFTNTLRVNESWTGDGTLFDSQIAGKENITTDDGVYSFIGWFEGNNQVNNFTIDWLDGNVIRDFIAVYFFTPNPEPTPEPEPTPTPVDNETNDTDPSIPITVENGTDDPIDIDQTQTNPIENTKVQGNEKNPQAFEFKGGDIKVNGTIVKGNNSNKGLVDNTSTCTGTCDCNCGNEVVLVNIVTGGNMDLLIAAILAIIISFIVGLIISDRK